MAQSDKRLSRRQVIRAGVISSGGVLAATVAGCERSGAAKAIRWDHEADIVSVGGGAAALTSAVVAHGNGDQVIVVEALAALGGTTAKSGGVFWIPNNHILREHGIHDSKSDCLDYLARYAQPEYYTPGHPTLGLPQFRYDMLSAIYDHGAPMVERMEKLGVFKAGMWDISALGKALGPSGVEISKSQPDYGENLPEDRVSRGRALCPYRADGSLGGGTDLVGFLEQYLRDAKQPILLKHRVRLIVQNSSGEVVGVAADTAKGRVYIRGRKAVIFGTGGYAQNQDFRMKYQRDRIYGTCSGAGSMGDLIPMAAKAGAALGNLSSAWRADGLVEEALDNNGTLGRSLWYPVGDSMIFVNKYGNRCVDEYRSYNSRAKNYLTYDATKEEYPNQLRFMIFDARTRNICAGKYPVPASGSDSPYIISAPNVEELASNLDRRLSKIGDRIGAVRLDSNFAARLKASIERFNGFARSGVDTDFGRGQSELDRDSAAYMNEAAAAGHEFMSNRTMYPISTEGPYYAVIVGMAVLDTNGGPVINTKGQVVDFDYKPIPGLYAAGNCAASPAGSEAYLAAGATIGPAMTFAYLAANTAHAETVKALA